MPVSTPAPATVTTEELAADLRITPRTVRALIAAGEISAVRVGPLWRVPRHERDRLVGLPSDAA